MAKVSSAVVVVGLVLGAVFVPVAFLPGTTGLLSRQFSLTIAFAVVLSVLNALTLSPALCALLPETASHGGPSSRGVEPRLRAGSRAYDRGVRVFCPRALMLRALRAAVGATWLLFRAVPHGVRARRRPGLLHHDLPGPTARRSSTRPRSRSRRRRSCSHARGRGRFSVTASASPARRRTGPDFAGLKDFASAADRAIAQRRVQAHPRPDARRHHGRDVVAFDPPPIHGLSTFGGFEFEVLEESGGDIADLANVAPDDRRGQRSRAASRA